MKQVRALESFEYPASRIVRDAIRLQHRHGTALLPWDQRGTIGYVEKGQVVDAPNDLLRGWIHNGLVEEVA